MSNNNSADNITPRVKEIIQNTDHYLVENLRTARRFISSLKLGLVIEEIHFQEMDKHFDPVRLDIAFSPIHQGKNIGVLSEAGMPGIADPGQLAVAYAHKKQIEVIPLEGGSSILLGLISSGFSGQQFTFHGYLPIDKSRQIHKLKEMETAAVKTGYTQLFMESPYRNEQLFKSMVTILNPGTRLFIGVDVTGNRQKLITKSVGEWRSDIPSTHKIPCIFGIGVEA